jgi:hypothetical protein
MIVGGGPSAGAGEMWEHWEMSRRRHGLWAWTNARTLMRLRFVRMLGVLIVVALGSSCGGGSGDDASEQTESERAEGTSSTGSAGDPVDVDDVSGVESVDRRPEVLSEVGGPDAFVITVDEVAGQLSRFESWSYIEAGSQIDFIDGEILWDVEIDDVLSGSLLPLSFSPVEFEMMGSVDHTLERLEGVELSSLDAAAAEFEVDGAELWAGEQLVLAFVDDALVYVEAFALAAVEPEVDS